MKGDGALALGVLLGGFFTWAMLWAVGALDEHPPEEKVVCETIHESVCVQHDGDWYPINVDKESSND